MVAREGETGVDLTVELCGIPLQTPLMPASGTLAREALGEVEGVYGAMLPKTTTPVARPGNPPPRVAETPAGRSAVAQTETKWAPPASRDRKAWTVPESQEPPAPLKEKPR